MTLALVGDVGGTRTRLALHDLSRDKSKIREEVLPSGEAASLEVLVQGFLRDARPKVAVLGVAAPVHAGEAKLTNLPWKLSESGLARALGAERVVLRNDLVIAAEGCIASRARDLDVLAGGAPAPRGESAAFIAAGTGLGEARAHWVGGRHEILATEAGHRDFAARTPLEVEIWQFAKTRFPDHVSWERVICGAGLGLLFDFFASQGARTSRAVEKKLASAADRNVAIAELGLARASRPAARAVDTFVSMYGAEAGNLALHELATGGVYVVGNVARFLVPHRREIFVESFLAKGRFRKWLEGVPLAVVRDSLVGVKGALAIARHVAGGGGGKRAEGSGVG